MTYLDKVQLTTDLQDLHNSLKDKMLTYELKNPGKDSKPMHQRLEDLEKGIEAIHELHSRLAALEKDVIKLNADILDLRHDLNNK